MLIQAMMTDKELGFLSDTVRKLDPDSVILEIGTYYGGSAQAMSRANPLVNIYTIDLFEDQGLDQRPHVYQKVQEDLKDCTNVRVLCGNAMTDFRDWKLPIDLYLEDGAHENPAMITNLMRWSSKVKPRGFVMLHDHDDYFPDVISNTKLLIDKKGFEMLHLEDSLALLQKL